jgi:hypothetical protein
VDSVADRIAMLDTALFNQVESQTGREDRRSLLALHGAIAEWRRQFSYLEIGSYLGGTLQPFVVDARCSRIISIDPRPGLTPDDRPGSPTVSYPESSATRMIELLGAIPGADVTKIQTIDGSTEDIAPGQLGRCDYCFIDGEHTSSAALRDARFCRAVLRGAGVIAFHDFQIVEPGITRFLAEVGRPMRAYLLKEHVFVVELGAEPSLLDDRRVSDQLRWSRSFWRGINAARAVRLLLRLDQLRRR